jgi:threonine dehydrogenase-like Zn-dependent dehydrogenase
LENNHLRLCEDLPIPKPPPGEALVRVRLAGICATDLELVRGYYPYTGILGHEFIGEVLDAPGDRSFEGARVVGEINASCGICTACRAGRSTHCENRTVLGIANRDGVFAEFCTLPLENLYRVPDGVPDEAAVFTEPLAASFEILEQVHIHPTDTVLVIGAGRLGLLVAQVLALTGCDIQVVARHDRPRQILEKFGIPPISVTQVPERSMDVVVEASGSPDGFALARRAVRPRGTIVMKSTYKGTLELNFSPLVVDEVQVVGSRCGPFPPALRALASGRVDPLPLIQCAYPLSEGLKAFEHAAKPGVLKILVRP